MPYIIRRIRRAARISAAILFGRYVCSTWDGEFTYVDYEFRGTVYRVPNTFD